jgi:hypothetical protein
MDAAASQPSEQIRRHSLDLDPALRGQSHQLAHPITAAIADAKRRHTPCAQRFEHGIDAVHDHPGALLTAAANAAARAAALGIGLNPEREG